MTKTNYVLTSLLLIYTVKIINMSILTLLLKAKVLKLNIHVLQTSKSEFK